MISRLSFSLRIWAIFLLGLMTLWMAGIVAFYLDHRGSVGTRPVPTRIAAIVELIEHLPAADRALALRAVTSETLKVELAPPGEPVGPSSPLPVAQFARGVLTHALAALGGREVAVTLGSSPRWLHALSALLIPEDIAFRVGLRTNDTLVIESRTLLGSLIGLPPAIGVALLGSLVGTMMMLLVHREIRPLVRLAEAIDRIDLSAQSARLPQPRRAPPEIVALIGAFNRLQARIAALLRNRMALVGGISHDVRSFATRLRLRVELIPAGPDRDRAVADIADMIRLLDDAMLASRSGAGELAEELVELDELARAEVAGRQAEGQRVTLSVSPAAKDMAVLGDRIALRRIIGNLIDNAVSYGTRARVSLHVAADELVLAVEDDGPGIPPAEREAMLEPFARLEPSRNRRTGGAGLGLAVVRSLVEAHGGRIAIGDAPGGGARVALWLPLFRPDGGTDEG